MKAHLVKHGISREQCDEHDDGRIRQQSIVSMLNKKTELEVTSLLERNLIRWIVMDDMAFTAIESPVFQQIFKDLPSVTLPFSCRKTVVRRIDAEFDLSRARLIEELARTSSTIALSLDVCRASSNTYIFITLSIYIHAYIHMDINRGLMHTYLSIHMKHLARPYYSRLLNELDG